jgi:hypothetical protein
MATTMRARRQAVVLIGVAAVAAGCGSNGSGDRPAGVARGEALQVGLSADLQTADRRGRARLTRQVRAAGVRLLREDVDWSRVERTPGRYTWSEPDRIFTSAAREGLELLPVLDSTPGWAARHYEAMPRDLDDYARFAAAAVARYGPGGTFWRAHRSLDANLAPQWFELYNEPYNVPAKRGGSDPMAYARAVVRAVRAARRANPRVRFLLAAETTGTTASGAMRPWLERLYETRSDLSEHFDGVAVHPYADDQSPERFTGGKAGRYQVPRIEDIRAELRRHGDGSKPVWITEIGWSTCRAGATCVPESVQARYLDRLFDLLRDRWAWVDVAVVFQLTDFPADPADKEGSFGVLRSNGTRKPAWEVLRRAARGG